VQYEIELIDLVADSDWSSSATESLSKSFVESSALEFPSSSTLVDGVIGNSESLDSDRSCESDDETE